MTTINHELESRKLELDNFINCVKRFESENCFSNESDNFPSINRILLITNMKASAIIMLYNVVESTMIKCLSKIHEIIIENEVCYNQLNDCIKKVILTYYENAISNSNDNHKIAEYKLEEIELLKEHSCLCLTYEQLSKYYPMYSGNLDAKQIRTILKRYGMKFDEELSELKTVKNNRNYLAHGEKTFEEVGREISLLQLNALHNRVFEYMKNVVYKIDDYLKNKLYLKS